MSEPTKRQLTIANMRLAKDLAQAQKRIRELEKADDAHRAHWTKVIRGQQTEIAKLKCDASNVAHAAQHLARLATP